MGTSRLGEASLCSLPEDVHLQILDLLPPSQIAVFAELCQATRATASSPSVWASVARRHLAVVVSAPSHATPTSVAALARGLLCRWWLATGLLVPGVAVHRRSGFVAVRSRGGLEVPLARGPDGEPASDTAYVFGGRHAARCTPAAVPVVELDFALDPAGPFPVDGLTLRLQHAAELPEAAAAAATADHSSLCARSATTTTTTANAPAAAQKDDKDPAAAGPAGAQAPPRARIRVEVNNTCVADVAVDASHDFRTLEVPIAASALVAKPGLNVLAVRYDRGGSTTGYWVRDVTVCPAVLPLPGVSAARVPAASTVDCGSGGGDPAAGLGIARHRRMEEAGAELWSAGSSTSSMPSMPSMPSIPSMSLPRPQPQPQPQSPRERGSSPRQVRGGGRHERSRNSRRDGDQASGNGSSNSSSFSSHHGGPSSPRSVRGGSGGLGAWSAAGNGEVGAGAGRTAKGKTPGAKARTAKHMYHQHQHHQRSVRTARTRSAR